MSNMQNLKEDNDYLVQEVKDKPESILVLESINKMNNETISEFKE